MDDVGPDITSPQPACRPETITMGFKDDGNMLDRSSRLPAFCFPSLSQLQQHIPDRNCLLQQMATRAHLPNQLAKPQCSSEHGFHVGCIHGAAPGFRALGPVQFSKLGIPSRGNARRVLDGLAVWIRKDPAIAVSRCRLDIGHPRRQPYWQGAAEIVDAADRVTSSSICRETIPHEIA